MALKYMDKDIGSKLPILDSEISKTNTWSSDKLYNEILGGNIGKKQLLFEGSMATVGAYILEDDVNNYDFIIINHKQHASAYCQSLVMSKIEISKCIDLNNRFLCIYGYASETNYVSGHFNNNNIIIDTYNGENITSITGYKLGQVTVKNTITNPSPGESYSTDEQLTGGTWIDGKPIYRKVLLSTKDITLLNSGDWTNIQGWSETSNLNIKDFVNINTNRFSCGNRTDFYIQSDKSLKFYSLASSVFIKAGSPLIIEYTKTTDA